MSDPLPGPAATGPSRRIVEAVTAIVLAGVGLVVIWESQRIGAGWASDGPQAGYFPFYIGLIMTGASLVNLARALAAPPGTPFVESAKLRLVFAVLAPTVVFVAAIPWLGLYVPAALFIAYFMHRLGKYSWLRLAPVAIAVPLITFALFELWFLVPLPKGPVEALLGY